MRNWLQRRFINWLVRDLFNTVTEQDILNIKAENGQKAVYYLGKRLTPELVNKVSRDALDFGQSDLLKLLMNEAKFIANKRMYEQSQTVEDMIAGKMLLYLCEILEQKIKQLSQL